MDRVIYTAMNGAARTAEHQAVLSNNLANVSTPVSASSWRCIAPCP